jgi:hypothetical protein
MYWITHTCDFFAHFCPKTRELIIFKNTDYKDYVDYNAVTGSGKLIKISDLVSRKIIILDESYNNIIKRVKPFLDTSEKGRIAEDIFEEMLKQRKRDYIRYPQDSQEQVDGIDFLVGKHKVQVKFDGPGGSKELGGSGNIFEQMSEINKNKEW